MFVLTERSNLMPRIVALTSAAVLLAAAHAMSHAAESETSYPYKPIRIIIPFSPGGSADNLARTLQPTLSSVLGQPLVLDNRRLLTQGVEIVGSGPREFDQTLREEIAKWTKLVQRAGITVE